MNHKINLHTHTQFCDGKSSAEDMVISAINKNFTVLGFSSHSLYPLSPDFYIAPDDDWHIHPDQFQAYIAEIERLKIKYADKIQIFTGFEADYFEDKNVGSAIPDINLYKSLNPDYLLGSVHFVNTPKGFYTVDHTAQNIQENLKKLYTDEKTGKIDGKKAVCEYFEAERQMLKKGSFQILGHADLVRKRNGVLNFFNQEESWYKEQVKLTVDEIAKSNVIVEINVGALARGIKDMIYPAMPMLEMLNSKGIPVCVNSDCHNAPDLDSYYELGYEVARKAGYNELIYPVGKQNFVVKL